MIGAVGKPHGVRGEITLRLFNQAGPPPDPPESLILERAGRRQTHAVTGCRPCAGGLLLTLEGIATREAAALLTGSEARVARGTLPALGPGEYYVADLIGCRVLAAGDGAGAGGGAVLGVVADTFWNGNHDVMIVRGDGDPAEEQMIPLVPDFVREVDAMARVVRVTWEP